MGKMTKIDWWDSNWQDFEGKLITKSFGPFSFTYNRKGVFSISFNDLVIRKIKCEEEAAILEARMFIEKIKKGNNIYGNYRAKSAMGT